MARELTLYGHTYHLTDGVENFANVRKEFEILSIKYYKSFDKELSSKCFNLQKIVEDAYDIADKYFIKAADVILNRLAQHDIYTMTQQDIMELAAECDVLSSFDGVFSEIEKLYDQTMQKAQDERDRREYRKASRSRFIGGGFGVDAAIRGSIHAGMLNAATGLGHSIINSFGNARTEREMREKISELYHFACPVLSGALKTTISNFYTVMLILLDKFELAEIKWPLDEKKKQAKAIMENLDAGRIQGDKISLMLFQAVTLDPFNENTYRKILEKYGDEDLELENFSEAHGIDLKSVKKSMLEQEFNDAVIAAQELYKKDNNPEKFDKELLHLKSKAEDKKKYLGFASGLQFESTIKKELKTLSERYKTVEGTTYRSIQGAKSAQKDLKMFYECVAIYGIESEDIREKIAQLKFSTSVVTENLEERLEQIKLLKNDTELGKRISNVFREKGFSITPRADGATLAGRVFILNASPYFEKNAERARKLAGIPAEEKIYLFFMCQKKYEGEFSWWVLTTDNLYTFESDEDEVNELKKVPFFHIASIRADNKGNLVTRIKDGVDRTTKLGLIGESENQLIRENLTKAMTEIHNLVLPLANRAATPETEDKDKKNDTKELNVKKLKESLYWTQAKSLDEGIKQFACINDNSSEFRALLDEAKQYWDCDFDDEKVYFVMIDSSIGSSIVYTSKRCYICGEVGSTKQKYVFPIEKTSTFREDGKGKKYCMFFDVDYFKENYFNCSDNFVCHNTVQFNMFNIEAKAGEYICAALTSFGKQIRQPMEEKKKKKEYYEKAIENSNDNSEISRVIEDLEKDTILDGNEKELLLLKAKQKLDKYNKRKDEIRALCNGLRDMSLDELCALIPKLEVISNRQITTYIARLKNVVNTEIQKKRDLYVQEEIPKKIIMIDSLSKEVLESEYSTWSSYSGNVTAVKEYLQAIEVTLKNVYQDEVTVMCSELERLSVDETKQLLQKLKYSFSRRNLIADEIQLVETALISKQEDEMKGWMPETTEDLAETEIDTLINRLNSGDYNVDLRNKYITPLVDKKNQFIVKKARRMIDFIKQKTSAHYLNSNISFEFQENNVSLSQTPDSVLICQLGSPMATKRCKIFLEGFGSNGAMTAWKELRYFEVKKKFLSRSLMCWYKNGSCEPVVVPLAMDELDETASLLNGLVSFINGGGINQEFVQQDTKPMPEMERFNMSVMTGVAATEQAREMLSTAVEEEHRFEQKQEPVAEGKGTSLSGVKRSFAEIADYVNKYPAMSKGSFLGNLNPKFSKKLSNAIKAYARNIKEEEVFALYDDTLFGSGKEGFVMTLQGLIIKTSMYKLFTCSYSDITGLKLVYNEGTNLTGLSVDTKNGMGKITGWLGEEASAELARRINEIVKYMFALEEVPFTVERVTIA